MATTERAHTTVLGTEPITADQLLEMYAKGMRGELIRGVFCPTMAAGVRHGEIVMKLGRLLGNVIADAGSGRIMGSDSGVRVESNPDTVREPDIAYFSYERLPRDQDVPGYAEVPPNLVAEIGSPSDTSRELFDKARMWITAGVDLVWVLWPETKVIEVHRPNQPAATLYETDTLTAEGILPQLSIPVADIFET